MADDDRPEQSDKVSEKDRAPEQESENASREAVGSFDDLIKMKQEAMADQKDPARLEDHSRAKFASVKFGRPEIVDEQGSVLVKGMEARPKDIAGQDTTTIGDKAGAALQEDAGSKRQPGSDDAIVEPLDGKLRDLPFGDPERVAAMFKAPPGSGAATDLRDFVQYSGGGGEALLERKEAAAPKRADEKPPANSEEFLKKHPNLRPERLSEEIKQQKQIIAGEKEQLEKDINGFRTKREELQRDLKEKGVNIDLNKATSEQEIRDAINNSNLSDAQKKDLAERSQKLWKEATDLGERKSQIEADERRVASLGKLKENLKAIDKIEPREKRQEIYRNLDLLMKPGDVPTGLSHSQRMEIAADLVNQIAHPEAINQGRRNTCAPATTEAQLARNNPDVYARAVTSWATTGEFQGSKIRDQAIGAIKAGDGDHRRSLASKVFQTGSAQLYLDTHAPGGEYQIHKPGTEPLPLGVSPSSDTGERVVVKDPKLGAIIKDWGGLDSNEQTALLNKLTGGDNYVKEDIPAPTAVALADSLQQAIADYGGPVQVGINKGRGGHSVTVTQVNEGPPRTITYEDPADPKSPQTVSIEQFHKWATHLSKKEKEWATSEEERRRPPHASIIGYNPPRPKTAARK